MVRKTLILVVSGLLFCAGCIGKGKTVAISDACPECSLGNNAIVADCIVSISKDDGSSYLTTQKHQICLCESSVIITSYEPSGEIAWKRFDNGSFKTIKGVENEELTVVPVCDKSIADIVQALMTANLTTGVSASGEPVNMYGQWYSPAESAGKYRLYINSATGLANFVKGADRVGRSYNFRKTDGISGTVPTTIEIFEASKEKVLGRKVIKIEYSDFYEQIGL